MRGRPNARRPSAGRARSPETETRIKEPPQAGSGHPLPRRLSQRRRRTRSPRLRGASGELAAATRIRRSRQRGRTNPPSQRNRQIRVCRQGWVASAGIARLRSSARAGHLHDSCVQDAQFLLRGRCAQRAQGPARGSGTGPPSSPPRVSLAAAVYAQRNETATGKAPFAEKADAPIYGGVGWIEAKRSDFGPLQPGGHSTILSPQDLLPVRIS